MTPQDAFNAGAAAATKAIANRQGGRRRSPHQTAKMRKDWEAQWASFTAGWSSVIKSDIASQQDPNILYSNGTVNSLSPEEEEKLVDVSIYTDRPGSFWRDMGPFFALRSVRKEMPYLVDDEGYVWFIARGLQGRIAGFASLHIAKSGKAVIHSLYVIPELRRTGIASRLINMRLSYLKDKNVKTVETTANEFSKPILEKFGFKEVGERGKYRTLSLDLESAVL